MISASIAFGYMAISSILEREHKKQVNDIVKAEREEKINQIYENLPKFWTIPVILGLILGFDLIVFGIEYFWNTHGITPSTYLSDGFGVVMTGVIVMLGSFAPSSSTTQ